MRKIIIKSVGPVSEAIIGLRQVNVIIGPQSLGKSTVLKIASYCSWVEKRIELQQTPDYFSRGDNFVSQLVIFHKMNGYFSYNSSVEYESEYMRFKYEHKTRSFSFNWKDARWDYKRSKITYIPAERNLVAVIPNWFEVSLNRNNIWNFMSEWETARKATTNKLDILNLDIAYHYEPNRKKDVIKIQNDNTLEITDISSGLQSLIPLFVHLSYISNGLYQAENARKMAGQWENEELLQIIYDELFVKKGKTRAVHSIERENEKGKKERIKVRYGKTIGSLSLSFSYPKNIDECLEIYNRYLMTDHCDIFLEEPENNLFPPTQSRLIDWLYDLTMGEHKNTLFIATHSPYVLSSLLEKKSTNVGMFYNVEQNGMSVVKSASDSDKQMIYDYGVDAFFNIDNLTE